MLQVRLELTTSASLAHILPYKYRALTDCATGAFTLYFRSLITRPTRDSLRLCSGVDVPGVPGIPEPRVLRTKEGWIQPRTPQGHP